MKTPQEMVGAYEPIPLHETFMRFLWEAKTIKERLGGHGHLLDEYVSMLLQMINGGYGNASEDDGYTDGMDFFSLCCAASKNTDTQNDALDEDIVSYIEANPLPFVEEGVKAQLYYIMHSSRYFEKAAKAYYDEKLSLIRSTHSTKRAAFLTRSICELLGNEMALHALDVHFYERFALTPLSLRYMQGEAQELAEILASGYTNGKKPFQLLLDGLLPIPKPCMDD